MKVGIIGGGAIAQVAHLPVLKKLKSIEVQAICDTDLPKARALADRFGASDLPACSGAIAARRKLARSWRTCAPSRGSRCR
mgnify:CR=1 FL=1